MKQRIQAGLIGADLSLRAGMVVRNLDPERAVIAAVCDRDPEMLRRFRESRSGNEVCREYTDFHDLLKDPALDAVFIMVRDPYHEEMAVDALEAGKAVFLEKPMAITIEGCDRILETAYRSGSKLFVGHNMR